MNIKIEKENITSPKDNIIDTTTYEKIYDICKKKALCLLLFHYQKRIDGRTVDMIRDISCEIGYLPSSHGSAIFTRGETQVLVSVTLGDKRDVQIKDSLLYPGINTFFLHYNFPNFSVGEIGNKNSVGRREIGHGNLALNGIKNMIDSEDINNYTIRVCSEVLSSNGSSSMATVCGSSLALMDAGVKIKTTVAGIAMGIIFDEENKNYKILTDISGDEDSMGDMDFKVVATNNGINALQLDVKKLCLTPEILAEGLQKAEDGIREIMHTMNKVISQHKSTVCSFAPCYKCINIEKKQIGQIIGIGGSIIQQIQHETKCFIFIDEKDTCGIVRISAPNSDALTLCEKKNNNIINVNVKVGDIYEDATVINTYSKGAMIEFTPGKKGYLYADDLDWNVVEDIRSVLHVGDKISVKIISASGQGRYTLSHKVLLKSSQNNSESKNSNNNIPSKKHKTTIQKNTHNESNDISEENNSKDINEVDKDTYITEDDSMSYDNDTIPDNI